MKFIYVERTIHFVSPKGQVSQGGVERIVVSEEEDPSDFSWYVNAGKYDYWQDDKGVNDSDELTGSDDGYNSEASSYLVAYITEEQYNNFNILSKAIEDFADDFDWIETVDDDNEEEE